VQVEAVPRVTCYSCRVLYLCNIVQSCAKLCKLGVGVRNGLGLDRSTPICLGASAVSASPPYPGLKTQNLRVTVAMSAGDLASGI